MEPAKGDHVYSRRVASSTSSQKPQRPTAPCSAIAYLRIEGASIRARDPLRSRQTATRVARRRAWFRSVKVIASRCESLVWRHLLPCLPFATWQSITSERYPGTLCSVCGLLQRNSCWRELASSFAVWSLCVRRESCSSLQPSPGFAEVVRLARSLRSDEDPGPPETGALRQ
jgi:hypothetical protein